MNVYKLWILLEMISALKHRFFYVGSNAKLFEWKSQSISQVWEFYIGNLLKIKQMTMVA